VSPALGGHTALVRRCRVTGPTRGEVGRQEERTQGDDRGGEEPDPQRLELGVLVALDERGVGRLVEAAVLEPGSHLVGRDEADIARERGLDRGRHLRVDPLVGLHVVEERVDEPTDHDRADERRAERRAELLGGPLQSSGLAAIGRFDRGLDHVAELGGDEPHADTEDRERDGERHPVEVGLDRAEHEDDGHDEEHEAGADDGAG
jgi:hypothetical protein